MRTDPLPTVALPRGKFLRMATTAGSRLECVRGTVWLTLDHDRRDIVLGAGRGFTLDKVAGALLGALEDSEVLLLAGGAP